MAGRRPAKKQIKGVAEFRFKFSDYPGQEGILVDALARAVANRGTQRELKSERKPTKRIKERGEVQGQATS